jgi:hypothetical protein
MADSLNKRPGSWERSYLIDIDNISKRHLKFFAVNEFEYYNRLIGDVTMRLRAFPEEINSMKGTYEKLWNALAYSNQNLRKLGKTKVSSWPESLKNSVTFLPIKDDQLQLDDRKLLIFDVLAENGKIHPQMRRSLASELIKTAIVQADALLQSQKSVTGQMRNAIQMLLPAEPHEKRHLQISKDLLELHWNKDAKQTEITLPYTDRPLIIRDQNITDEKFTMMIVRPLQAPDGQWQIVLYNTPARYMLELRDPVPHMRRR